MDNNALIALIHDVPIDEAASTMNVPFACKTHLDLGKTGSYAHWKRSNRLKCFGDTCNGHLFDLVELVKSHREIEYKEATIACGIELGLIKRPEDIQFLPAPSKKIIKTKQNIVKFTAEPVEVPYCKKSAPEQLYQYLLGYQDSENVLISIGTYKDAEGADIPARPKLMKVGQLKEKVRAGGVFSDPTGVLVKINPMLEIYIDKADGGKRLAYSRDTVDAYRYLLLEFDTVSLEKQLGIMMASRLPINAVTYSGGKSLHFRVYLGAESLEEYEEKADKIYSMLRSYGIDGANKNPDRYTRLPGSARNKGIQCAVEISAGWRNKMIPDINEWIDKHSLGQTLEVDFESEKCRTFKKEIQHMAKDFMHRIDDTLIFHMGSFYQFDGSHYNRQTKVDTENLFMRYLTFNFDNYEKALSIEKQKMKKGDDNKYDDYKKLKPPVSTQTRANLIEIVRSMLPEVQPKNYFAFSNSLVIDIDASVIQGKMVARSTQKGDFTFKIKKYPLVRGVSYSEIEMPLFTKFLRDSQIDKENAEILQMMSGHCLVGEYNYNVMFHLYGEPGTGKSVYTKILCELVGVDNMCSIDLCDIGERFNKIDLTQKTLNLVSDDGTQSAFKRVDEATLKKVTGGEHLRCEIKGNPDIYTAPSTALVVSVGNEMGHISDRSGAIADRLRVVPFKGKKFRGSAEQDRQIDRKIIENELSAVFCWAFDGLLRLSKLEYFPEHKWGVEDKNKHLKMCAPELMFADECLVENMGASVNLSSLYNLYTIWLSEEHGKRHPLTKTSFTQALSNYLNTGTKSAWDKETKSTSRHLLNYTLKC